MTAKTLPVRAEWALHGKVLDNQGYRVIACSSGDLNKANFTDAVGRFALGAVDTLPQVSVSYLQHATRPGAGYMALAIHWSAGNGKRFAEGVGPVDDHGRPTTFTNYFCAPYAALAPHRISYLDMYKAFSAVTLSAKDGPPRDVPLTLPTQRVPAVGELATRVVPLLLTGAPVCVLGAEETQLDERLRFIDTVMGLLPYGFRAKMAAATWTRATNRDHRFRLFFSSEPRSGDKQDHVVHWADPAQARMPGGDAYRYYQWLTDKISPLASLTELRDEIGFGDTADSQAYRMVTLSRLGKPGRSGAAKQPDPPAPARPAVIEADPATRILTECAEHMRIMNVIRVREDISVLKNLLRTAQFNDDLRKRYRALITKHGLLKPDSGLKRKDEADLYETLLALAFGDPVTYLALCRVEHSLGNTGDRPVHSSLLEAMIQIGTGDLRAKVLVQSDLDPKKLPRPLGSRDSDAHALINELALGAWYRQRHGRVMCDVTLRYLQARENKYSTAEMQRVLLRNGYLAQALRDIGNDQYQVQVIAKLLDAAFPEEKYPRGLDRAAFTEILANAPVAPTPALLAAILRYIPVSEAPVAREAFAYGSVLRMNLAEETRGELLPRLPVLEPASPAEVPAEQPPEAFRETPAFAPPPSLTAGARAVESGPPTNPPAEQDRQQGSFLSRIRSGPVPPWAKPRQDPGPGQQQHQAQWQGPPPAPAQRPQPPQEPFPGYFQGSDPLSSNNQ